MNKFKKEEYDKIMEEEEKKVMSKNVMLRNKRDRLAIIKSSCKGKFYTQYKRPPKELFTESSDDRTVTETAGVRSTFDRIMAVKRAGIMLDNFRKEHYDINPGTEEEDYNRLYGLESQKVDGDDFENSPDKIPPDELEKKIEKVEEKKVDDDSQKE